MKSKEKAPKHGKSLQNLQKLSLSVGDFIRYWGFRRVHGAIWTQLYLSKTPLSCTELTGRLDLSKALISPALEELCEFKLIYEAPAPNEKTKVYAANPDINAVIQHVLRTREAKMLKQINSDFSRFNDSATDGDEIDAERVQSLGQMIVAANLMLEIMMAQKDIMQLPMEIEK